MHNKLIIFRFTLFYASVFYPGTSFGACPVFYPATDSAGMPLFPEFETHDDRKMVRRRARIVTVQ